MLKKKVSKTFLLLLVIILVGLPFFLLRNYFVLGYKFLYPDYSKLKSKNGVVSVLILGKGGEGHTAPDLTDTLINVFISQKSKKISLLPLPRDIWIPEIRAKINSAYYWDKQRENEDYELTKKSVESVTGMSPDYVIVVDFSMFENLVDALGGIEVEVETSFVDEKFPILGKEEDLCDGDEQGSSSSRLYACRYETVQFDSGNQNMNGATALKFVRSRNSEGNEGTDLAREARQQKIINAIKDRILSEEILLSPKKISFVLNSVLSNIETDIENDTAIVLARTLLESKDNIQNLSISEELMVVSNNSYKYDYQYVFLPSGGSWKEFSEWLAGLVY